MEQQDQKRSLAGFFGRFNVNPHYLLTNRLYHGNDVDTDLLYDEKRQSNKKWAKMSQGSQSPFTIAFPALIRTRRWIEQEQ
ncbi:unnamed protein product [Rotaria sp. Silwood1]|nr:unnamed protein product [Rotaria sp. Silwood1]